LGRHLSATASSPAANYNTPSRRHS
jgi:hypothetical protein